MRDREFVKAEEHGSEQQRDGKMAVFESIRL